jgi:hypothetical protein
MSSRLRLQTHEPTENRTPRNSSFLKRKCACGRQTVDGGECLECREKRFGLKRQTNGQPMLAESRFGHDFSAVRVYPAAGKGRIQPAGFIGEIDDTPCLVPGADGGGGGSGASATRTGGGCTDICDRAYADSSLNSNGGGVICDGATKCPCVFDVSPLRKGQCPGFDAVVLAHERQHLPDVDCNPSGGLHRPPFRNPSQGVASECTHRGESIAEMNRIIPRAAGICKTGMISIRDQLNTWVSANCGGGSAGSGTPGTP